MPKVTVIIPNFNHARFLRKRIDSVIGQSFRDLEILCLDDASTDGSVDIIQEYARSGCFREIFLNRQNGGSPFRQWNRGIQEAHGEYIWIAESDDRADPGFLRTLVALLDENSSAGLAFCESRVVDDNDTVLGLWNQQHSGPGQFWNRTGIYNGKNALVNSLIRENTIPNASAVLFRRALYEKAGGADESMRLCGDYLLWVRMLLVADIAHIAEPLNDFRCHSATARSKHSLSAEALRERCAIVQLITSRVQVPAEVLDEVAEEIARSWMDADRPADARLSWRGHLSVYRALKSFDLKAADRVTARLRYRWSRMQLPGRRALKKLWRKVIRP